MLNHKKSIPLRGRYNILLAEPCPVTLLGLRKAISLMPLQIESIAETGQLTEAPKLIEQHRADMLITELSGDDDSVLDVLYSISHCTRHYQHQIPVVVCTTLQNASLFQLLRAINVRGICLKQEPIETLTYCIERTLQGYVEFSPMVSQYLPENNEHCLPLTEKELEVLMHLFKGKNVTEVAKAMNRDIRTISTHKINAMRKVGFKNDSEMFSNSKWMELQS
jgi:two-component system capsular synthesis response regulator RcsB